MIQATRQRAGFTRPARTALAALVLMLWISTGATVRAQDSLPLVHRLPPDTWFYAATTNPAALVRAAREISPLGRCLRDPAVKVRLEPLIRTARKLGDQLAAWAGPTPVRLLQAARGPAALALVDLRGEAGPPVPDLVLAMKLETRGAEELRHWLRELASNPAAAGRGLTLHGDTHGRRDREILVWRLEGGFSVRVCVEHDTLHVATSAEALDRITKGPAGPAPGRKSLARHTRFQTALASVHDPDDTTIVAYLNTEAILAAADSVLGRGFPEYDLLVDALALRGLRGVAASLQVTAEGFHEQLFLDAPVRVRARPESPDLPAAPARSDHALFRVRSRMNWDALSTGLLTGLEQAARVLQSETAAEWRGNLRLLEEGAFGFRWREHVLPALGREASLTVRLPPGGLVPEVLILTAVRDRERLARALADLASLAPSGWFRAVSFRDQPLYLISMPDRDHQAWRLTPALALADSCLVVGSTPAAVKAWLSGSGSTSRGPARSRATPPNRSRPGNPEPDAHLFLDVPVCLGAAGPWLSLLTGGRPLVLPLWPGFRWKLDPAEVSLPPEALTVLGSLRMEFRATHDGLSVRSLGPAPGAGLALGSVLGLLGHGCARHARPAGEVGIYVDDSYAGHGCRVAGVVPDSAAARAGIRTGDILIRIDDRSIARAETALEHVRVRYAGDRIRLTVIRPDPTKPSDQESRTRKPREVSLVLEAQDPD